MDEPSKAVGRLIQAIGLVIILIGTVKHSLTWFGIGTIVTIIGRLVAEFWEDWFE